MYTLTRMEYAPLNRFSHVRLYVIISSTLSKKPVLETLEEVICGGADAVQLREKAMNDVEFLALAKKFRDITAKTKTCFIVNDRADIARYVNADGLHIGQLDITIPQARKIIGSNSILGVSTHTITQARLAQLEGADYIGAGPIYRTSTKNHEPPVGLDLLRQISTEITIPFVAIGGITLENINEVIKAGGKRVAVCSAIINSKRIAQATRRFKTRLIAT